MEVSRSALISFLKSKPPLDPEKAVAVANEFQHRVLKKNDLFLKEGKVSNEYLFLETGFIRTFLSDTEGNEITLNFYAQNQLVFEVASFFKRTPSQENFEALTDGTGWVLTYDQLNTLFHALPEFREFGRAVLVNGFIAYKERTLSMINKTAEQRYELLINTNPEIFRNAPLKYIASYLGMTDTSLSRIRKSFINK
ncbi:MAG: Crp/Fnr family transcriptional regulator [Chitinophagales bacterium]